MNHYWIPWHGADTWPICQLRAELAELHGSRGPRDADIVEGIQHEPHGPDERVVGVVTVLRIGPDDMERATLDAYSAVVEERRNHARALAAAISATWEAHPALSTLTRAVTNLACRVSAAAHQCMPANEPATCPRTERDRGEGTGGRAASVAEDRTRPRNAGTTGLHTNPVLSLPDQPRSAGTTGLHTNPVLSPSDQPRSAGTTDTASNPPRVTLGQPRSAGTTDTLAHPASGDNHQRQPHHEPVTCDRLVRQGHTCVQALAGGWISVNDLCMPCTAELITALNAVHALPLTWHRAFLARRDGVD